MQTPEQTNQEAEAAVQSTGKIYRAALEAEKSILENKSLNVRDFFLGIAFLAAQGDTEHAEEIFERILVISGDLHEQRHDFFQAKLQDIRNLKQ